MAVEIAGEAVGRKFHSCTDLLSSGTRGMMRPFDLPRKG